MIKKIHVNPDHYKTAGRERQEENIVQSDEKQKLRNREKSERNILSRRCASGRVEETPQQVTCFNLVDFARVD